MPYSFSLKRLELAGAARGLDGDRVVLVVVNQAAVDHLRHEVGGHLARLVLLLEGHHLLLEFLDLPDPGLVLRFLLGCCFLVGLDLREGASSLAADLQHVGRDAFGDYDDDRIKTKICESCTYD